LRGLLCLIYMKKLLLLLVLAGVVGCVDGPSRQTYVAQGTIRSIWCQTYCVVVFEHDTHEAQSLTFREAPPFWQGEHVELTYQDEFAGGNGIVRVVRVRRLP
jgi:hypothetical protein